MEIREFSQECETEWDNFVDNIAINGTFLQSRRFLNYHKDRFHDCSLMFYRNSNLVCVCPACMVITANGDKEFWSHKGSTFGGLVMSDADKTYTSSHVIEMIQLLRDYLESKGYDRAYLKLTSDLFSQKRSDLLQYCLWNNGFEFYCELSTYVDYAQFKPDIISNFGYNHRREKNKYTEIGAEFRALSSSDEVRSFHDLLTENLSKHNAKPVHSYNELLNLKTRLDDEIEFFGVFVGNEIVAGAMMFYFHNTNTAHTQYMCSRQILEKFSPVSFLYYSILSAMWDKGFSRMSWGISTEENGKVLNKGLIWIKESVGSLHSINRTYFINLKEDHGNG